MFKCDCPGAQVLKVIPLLVMLHCGTCGGGAWLEEVGYCRAGLEV